MNKVLIDEFGDQVGSICYKAFHNREESCPLCKSSEVMKGKTVRWEWHSRRMPGMDGLEFLDEVRETRDSIPFVFSAG